MNGDILKCGGNSDALANDLKYLSLVKPNPHYVGSPTIPRSRDSVFLPDAPTIKQFLFPTNITRRKITSTPKEDGRMHIPKIKSAVSNLKSVLSDYSGDEGNDYGDWSCESVSTPVFGGMVKRSPTSLRTPLTTPSQVGTPLKNLEDFSSSSSSNGSTPDLLKLGHFAHQSPVNHEQSDIPSTNVRHLDFDDSAYLTLTDVSFNSSSEKSFIEPKPVFENFVNLSGEKNISSDEGFAGSSPELPKNFKKHSYRSSPAKFDSDKFASKQKNFKRSPQRIGRALSFLVKNGDTKRVDFLKKFNDNNCQLIIDKIFQSLDDKDLIKVTEVCRLWNSLTARPPHEERIKTFRSRRLNRKLNRSPNKEKRGMTVQNSNKQSKKPKSPKKQNSPFKIISKGLKAPKAQHLIDIKRSLESGESVTYCNCQWPAKKLPNGKGICTRENCYKEFCAMCKKDWHEGECAVLITSSRHSSPKSRKRRIKKNLKKL